MLAGAAGGPLVGAKEENAKARYQQHGRRVHGHRSVEIVGSDGLPRDQKAEAAEQREQARGECEDLALRASEAVQALMAGVDVLPGADGKMYVLEVNAVPGWRALASVTGMDIAKEVLRFLVTEFPDGVGGS